MLEDLNPDKKLSLAWLAKCLLVITLFASCDSEKPGKPGFTGSSGELLIVTDEATWNGIKDSISVWFQPNYPMLPQPEALFRVAHFQPSAMNDLLNRHRNILSIVRSNKQENSFKLYNEQYSKEQIFFELSAYNSEEILDLLGSKKDQIIKILQTAERERLVKAYSRQVDNDINVHLKKHFGFTLNSPIGATLEKSTDNFLWIKREREKSVGSTSHFIYQGLALYTRPYTSDQQFSDSALISDRNKYMGDNIPGPKPTAKMSTQTFITPTNEKVLFNNRFAVESRGLWRTTNSFMGGPYVALTTTDPSGKVLITVEGFVYAPKFDKREYIKEMEAIIYSLRFTK